MDDHERLDFITSLGEEFSTVLEEVTGLQLSIQDGYEVFSRIPGNSVDAQMLRVICESNVNAIAAFANSWFEIDAVKPDHICRIIENTLRRQ